MDDVLSNPGFQEVLRQISHETGRPVADLEREAAADLKEMATRPGKLTVAGWDRFCQWLARAYRVDFEEDQIKTLRSECIDTQPNDRCGDTDQQRLPAGFYKSMHGWILWSGHQSKFHVISRRYGQYRHP